MRRRMLSGVCAVVLAVSMPLGVGTAAASVIAGPVADAPTSGVTTAGTAETGVPAAGKLEKGPQGVIYEPSFDVEKFLLPEDASVLVVVEGTFGTECFVHAFEKNEGNWEKRFQVNGWLGYNGLCGDRVVGDRTTPIGVFQMNTPFGQEKPLEGFPKNYIQVDGNYVWDEETNRLVRDHTRSGERVGTAGYLPQYQYVLDMGYNKYGYKERGSALFIHCKEVNEDGTMGCVAIDKDRMIELMRLYGKYGDGRCYIALAPFGTFGEIYETYGTNYGLSPQAKSPVGGPIGTAGQTQ